MKPDDFNVVFDYSMEGHDSQESVEGYLVPGKEWGRHVKCKNCQLIYMNPMEEVSKTNEYYSKAKNTHAPTIRESYLRTAESQVAFGSLVEEMGDKISEQATEIDKLKDELRGLDERLYLRKGFGD